MNFADLIDCVALILGEEGAGKTAFAYANAIMEMYNRKRLKQAKNLVYQLVEGGYKNLRLQDDYLVYTETAVLSRLFGHRPQFTYVCNGSRFGLPNDKKETDFYPPFAYIVIDEGQKDADSRNFKNLEAYVKRAWETRRHMGYDLVYVSQWGNVDKCLRNVANRIVYLLSKGQRLSDGKYKHIQSYWSYTEFKTYDEFETWFKAGKPDREKKEFLFDGDIRRCYDGEAYRALWFKGRENADFTKVKHEWVGLTVESFNKFLERMG